MIQTAILHLRPTDTNPLLRQWAVFLPALPKAKAGLGMQSLRPSQNLVIATPLKLRSNYHETWYVDRNSYVVMHIGRKFWSPHFCGSYAPWKLENIRKSTNNLSFLCQFSINEITASDAGPDIIRSHLFLIENQTDIVLSPLQTLYIYI